MNLLTPITLGEIQAFLASLGDDVALSPCWNAPAISTEQTRVSFARTATGSVRTFRNSVNRALTRGFNGQRYDTNTLVDVRTLGVCEPMTLGMLISSVRSWKRLGE